MFGLLTGFKPSKSLSFYTAKALLSTWKIIGSKNSPLPILDPMKLFITFLVKSPLNEEIQTINKEYPIMNLSPSGIMRRHEDSINSFIHENPNSEIIGITTEDIFNGISSYEKV